MYLRSAWTIKQSLPTKEKRCIHWALTISTEPSTVLAAGTAKINVVPSCFLSSVLWELKTATPVLRVSWGLVGLYSTGYSVNPYLSRCIVCVPYLCKTCQLFTQNNLIFIQILSDQWCLSVGQDCDVVASRNVWTKERKVGHSNNGRESESGKGLLFLQPSSMSVDCSNTIWKGNTNISTLLTSHMPCPHLF